MTLTCDFTYIMYIFQYIDGQSKSERIIYKKPDETEENFLKRIEFIILCIQEGYNLERSETLGFCYSNKLKYYTKYGDDIENRINKIVSIM